VSEEPTVTPKSQPVHAATESPHPLGSPEETVIRFLDAMQDANVEEVIALAADEIVYSNVSLPTIRGKDRFSKGVRAYYRHRLGFEVIVHRIASNGSSVLTERTDALIFGPFRMQFWVCGVFEVENGQITLWRDYFDWRSTSLATLRGLVGILIPQLRAKFSDDR
jgi:limonene-1,2-epoxide hydrolase